MKRNLQIHREHDLNETECRAMAEDLLAKLVGHFGGGFNQDGEDYLYKHTSGIKAKVQPKDGELLVDVKLGLMTRALAPQIEREMNRVLDEHLT